MGYVWGFGPEFFHHLLQMPYEFSDAVVKAPLATSIVLATRRSMSYWLLLTVVRCVYTNMNVTSTRSVFRSVLFFTKELTVSTFGTSLWGPSGKLEQVPPHLLRGHVAPSRHLC